ncbi:MAG: Asp/Glu racemase [Rhodospirillaceae bacterium]|nr:Asp/Glu racemase [Rhodospirillaceae bacterium]
MSDAITQPGTDNGLLVNLQHIPFETDPGLGGRARIGLIVLASDHTVEHEFRRIIDIPGVAFYESRILNSPTITPETLADMGGRIEGCASVILPGMDLDVVAFGCTSASMVLGEETVFERVRAGRPEAKPTNPVTSAFAAFKTLGVERIALLTPYTDDINQGMRAYFEAGGVKVPVMGSFNEESDNVAARITQDAIRNAALTIGRHDAVDAVFVSCTSLRLAEVAADIEADLGKPVTSSNHAMAWHCLRLAGIEDKLPHWGKLYGLGLAE